MEEHNEPTLPIVAMVTISTGASVNEIAQRAKIIDQLYRQIMKKDVHYGVIPGTGNDKPTLLKAGAEKLMSVFNLGCDLHIEKTMLPEGHREYQVIADIKHYPTGKFIGSGIGVCSTMESKYRYRNVADFEVTDEVIPRDAKEKKAEYRKKGYGMRKIEGEFVWVKYGDSDKSENPDIADIYNTCIKMAKKRAQIDGVLTATGASDIFTQDIEDYAEMLHTDEGAPLPFKAHPVKKVEVVEGVEVWMDIEVDDVDERKLSDGKTYYIVKFLNGKSCGTIDSKLAHKAAGLRGPVKAEVRPGRKPDSKVLVSIEAMQEGPEPEKE